MYRRLLAAFVVALGAVCGCRSSEGMLTAPPSIESQQNEVEPTLIGFASESIAQRDPLRAPGAKAKLPLPGITPRWGLPCWRKFIRINSWDQPGYRVDWYANFCGDHVLRITDAHGERWIDWNGNPVARPW